MSVYIKGLKSLKKTKNTFQKWTLGRKKTVWGAVGFETVVFGTTVGLF